MYHGGDGLGRIAARVHGLAAVLAAGLRSGGAEIVNSSFFDTVTVRVPGRAVAIASRARELRINLRVVDGDTLGIALDETTTPTVVEGVWRAFGVSAVFDEHEGSAPSGVPGALARRSNFLTHPVFE